MLNSMLTSQTWKQDYASAKTERLLRHEATVLEASYIEFFAAAWPEIDPAPLKLNWHHEAIAEHLEAVAFGRIKKLLINCPPRHTKSLEVSVAWPAWIWAQEVDAARRAMYPLLGPQCAFMCFSYADSLALDHALLHKRLVQSQWYQSRWGRRVQIRTDKEASSKFDTTASGTRMSGSILGGATGRGGDIRIFDDPHNVRQSESQTIRESVINTYDSALKNRVTDPASSAEVIVMQRSNEGDLAGHVLGDDPDYVHLMLPAEFEPTRHCITYAMNPETGVSEAFWADPRTVQGQLLWPEQWGEAQLAPFKLNSYVWAGQYQQRPSPKGGAIVRREWWNIWGDEDDKDNEKPENAKFKKHPPYSHRIGVVDTAHTEREQNDPSGMGVWGVFEDSRGFPAVMLANAWIERLAFPDLLKKVIDTARKFQIDTLLIEISAAGLPLEAEIRRYYADERFTVEMIPITRSSGDKAARLQAVTPVFKAGQVWAPFKPWAESFITEVEIFPRGLHDECVDLTSMGLKYLRRLGLLDNEHEIRVAEVEARKKPPRHVPLYPGTN
jgi:predicted phage terminase large subunit-like protein